MRFVLACLLGMTVVAHAQAPGTTAAAPGPLREARSSSDVSPSPSSAATAASDPAPVTYTFGVDAQASFGDLVGWRLAGRFELGIAPGHALVLRGGVGALGWADSEVDDPTYQEIVSRLGYRISSRRLFAGVELGKSWFKPHYPPEEQMGRDPRWFSDLTLAPLVGVRLGRVRLSLDYKYDFTSPVRQVGLQLGVDIVTL